MNAGEFNEETILEQALTFASKKDRESYLGDACGSNQQLRARVMELIEAHESAGAVFLADEPAPAAHFQQQVTPPEEMPGNVIGRYKLLERVGEGGCGVVYVAEQTDPIRRRIALKVIKPGMDSRQVIARFEAERQALAMMDHPNIAKVLDAGTIGAEGAESQISDLKSKIPLGRPYFVMELVRGIKITDYCDQNNLSTRDRLDLFILVCHAIQHAHQKGIIHRDIKPSNILVTLHDGVPVPKVIDFGIAKATEGRLTDATVYTQLHQFIGTPAYMSPEQAEMGGLDIDTRSDIYALGVLLYELLTGKTPFDAKTLVAAGLDEMRRIIREEQPVRPSTRITRERLAASAIIPAKSAIRNPQSAIDRDLDWIVMKCLEKDRTRRYETANALAQDLARHLSHEPVVARPPSFVYRLQKAWKRNKLVFTAATLVTAALVAGIAVSTWQRRAAEAARVAEHDQRVEAQNERDKARLAQAREAEQRQRADVQARKAMESERQSRRFLYASEMSLAQQALKRNDLGRARRLLDRHRPKAGEDDLRGWEWRYLWQLTRGSASTTLTNRPVRGRSVSLSPDGTRLAVGWEDGRVDLWDVPGRRLLRNLTETDPHQNDAGLERIGRVAFSPVLSLLAATSKTAEVILYDLEARRERVVWQPPSEGLWEVRELAFSIDGSWLVIYAGSSPEFGDAAWVVNITSGQASRYRADFTGPAWFGAARLSPDNQRLYLPRCDQHLPRYRLQCIDMTTGEEIWLGDPERDWGLTALDISHDGRVLASGSGYEDPAIRIWDAATGRLRFRLDGHTGWVCRLIFTRDGRRLISAAADQTIRIWDTATWQEMHVLRGHTHEVHALALSERAQFLASAGKDGNLMLWNWPKDGGGAAEGYLPLSEELMPDQLVPMGDSRLLLLPAERPPESIDLRNDASAAVLAGLGFSSNVLSSAGTNALVCWDGTNRIVVHELRGGIFIRRGDQSLNSGARPTGAAYNPRRKLLAWTEPLPSSSLYVADLASSGHPIGLESDVAGLTRLRFSENGQFLLGRTPDRNFLRVWSIESRRMVVVIDEPVNDACFGANDGALVAILRRGSDHEIVFHDLAHPDQAPRRSLGRYSCHRLTVSPDGARVAASTGSGVVRIFDCAKGELMWDLHGSMFAAFGIAFSPDGQRLISAGTGREAVKLWDASTWQELLTLPGTGALLAEARWTADGDAILAGAPWQAWLAPSWEEIAAAEEKENAGTRQP